jgi:two-component system cell cycle response regulator DivK
MAAGRGGVREGVLKYPESHTIPTDMSSTILLVDDYPDAVDVLALYLRGEGFTVVTAGDGEEALAEAQRSRPHLIVMDLEMPLLSGYEVAVRLRAMNETAAIPLIAATGHSHSRQLDEAMAAGFNAVIVKPCDPEQLVREIRRLLDSHAGAV